MVPTTGQSFNIFKNYSSLKPPSHLKAILIRAESFSDQHISSFEQNILKKTMCLSILVQTDRE